MMIAEAVRWARRRTLPEWLALAAGLGVIGYLAWDSALWDARLQLLLHLVGIGAIGGMGVLAWREGVIPRTPLDIPLLALLAALALATVGALNLGMSLRAMAAIVAFAAMLPVALLALRHRPGWVGFVLSAPVLVLAVPTLVALVARRLEWILVGAPGLPPLRLAAEGTPFGSVAVPPFVLIPAWALAGLIDEPTVRRVVRLGLVAVGLPLVVLSGSRSAWLAIAGAVLVGVAPWAWQQRGRLRLPRRLSPRGVAVGAAALGAAALVLALVIPRATAVTSLLYRAALWRDTLQAWASDPLLGIGPGFMPYARQAAAADYSFPVRQPHSHNLPLGVLGDAGLVGLAAALLLAGTLLVVAGPWRSRTAVGRTAAVVLVGLGFGALFEDLTFLPGFNLLVITLVAVVLEDAGAVRWVALRRRVTPTVAAGAATAAAAGLALLAAMVVSDAAAIAYRAGIKSAEAGEWAASTAWLRRAVEVDPWQPAGPRALAVAADAGADAETARAAAARATALNPGDATSWINLALLCEAAADGDCASHAAGKAVANAPFLASELINAAQVLDRLGETDAADAAYRLSLLSQPATAFVVDWARTVRIGDGRLPGIAGPSWELNLLLARWTTSEPITPAEFADPAVRAMAHAIRGERPEAERWLAIGIDTRSDDIRTHDIAVILRDAWGEPVDDEIRVASAVRGRTFPARSRRVGMPGSVLDVGSFRAYPRDGFVSAATRLSTRPPFPWTLQETLP